MTKLATVFVWLSAMLLILDFAVWLVNEPDSDLNRLGFLLGAITTILSGWYDFGLRILKYFKSKNHKPTKSKNESIRKRTQQTKSN